MKILIKKYPNIDLNNITMKDIIFFCRKFLIKKYSQNKKILNEKNVIEYENEIYQIIQKKYEDNLQDWNWHIKDIDGNNILTFPIFHNSFKIVEYLLNLKNKDNGKNFFDLKIFNNDIKNALNTSINLYGEDMINFIISQEINSKYISNMITTAYEFFNIVEKEEEKDVYQKIIGKLYNKDFDSKEIIREIIKKDIRLLNNLVFFLEEIPIKKEQKIQEIQEIFEEEEIKLFHEIKWNYFKKWIDIQKLEINLNKSLNSKILKENQKTKNKI